MNINEKIVPILANKDGKPGVAFKNTETGEVSGWTAKDDITPEQKAKVDPYATQQGKGGYRIDPEQFKRDTQQQAQQAAAIQRQKNLEAGSRKQGESTADFHRRLRQQLDADRPTTRDTTGGDTTGGEVRQPPKPAPKPTLDPKLKADLDKFAPKINQDWAAANERLARVELARAQQRAAGKSVFDKEFRKTKVNPIMYKQPSVEKEAYEVVLDYLLSEGHADTVEEAHYVMMQLDSEFIQDIVEGVGTYKDPVLGPHTPGGKAVRKIGRMGRAAVKGFQRSQAQGLNRLGDAIDAAQTEYQKKVEEQMMPPIDPVAHNKVKRIRKAEELQKRTTGPESDAGGSAVKRLGGSGINLPPV